MTAEPYLPAWGDVVTIVAATHVPVVLPAHPAFVDLQQPTGGMMATALQLAVVAHAAVGQVRADGRTPYITHPVHVAALAVEWTRRLGRADAVAHVFAVACLHDVLEDTALRSGDLAACGIGAAVIDDVVALTKIAPDAYEEAAYFEACARRFGAWIVKLADRTSNLMSATADVIPGGRNQRWKNSAARTRADMLPVFERCWPPDITPSERDDVLEHLRITLRACERACAA